MKSKPGIPTEAQLALISAPIVSIWDDKRLLFGLLGALCIGNFAIFSGPLYIGGLIDGYDFNEAEAGFISTLEIGGTALVCLFLPNRVAHVALRQAGIYGALVVMIVNLVTPAVDSFSVMAGVRLVAGLAAGVTLAVASTVIARSLEPDRLVAVVLVINTLVMALVLAIMGYAKQAWFFNGVVYTYAAALVLLLPLLWLLPRTAANDYGSLRNNDDNAGLGRWPILGVLGIALIFLFCVIEGSVYAFSERSGLRHGLVESDIGLLLAGAQISGLLGGSIPAAFGDRIPRLGAILIGITFVTAAGVVIYQFDSASLYVFALLGFSFGFFLALPYLIGNCARLDTNGVWVARATGGNLLGGAIAPVIAGGIVSVASYESLGTMALLLGVVSAILAIVFFRFANQGEL